MNCCIATGRAAQLMPQNGTKFWFNSEYKVEGACTGCLFSEGHTQLQDSEKGLEGILITPLMLMRETRSSRGDFITYRALVDADIIVRNDGKEGSGKIDSSYASKRWDVRGHVVKI